MLRFLILVHRYLGIAIGFVVALWCLSGFVMMYVPYPELTAAGRAAGLEPLAFRDCCADVARPLASLPWIDDFHIEMLAGRPVLRVLVGGEQRVVDLTSGRERAPLTPADAEAVSRTFAERLGREGRLRLLGKVDRDQWTLAGELEAARPLFEFAAGDAAGTEWYVSAPTGEVVQVTTARQRFWNRLGAVPHWLYFTPLRRRGPAWARTVIWLSLAALLLTVLGLYLGIVRLRPGRAGLSPYRGWLRWHHYAGLGFGALTLTWLLSGCLSMNPWGALEGRSFASEEAGLRGGEIAPEAVASVVAGLASRTLPPAFVRLDSALVDGTLALVGWRADGTRVRLAAYTLAPRPLDGDVLAAAPALLRPHAPVASADWMRNEDAYYFSHHDRAALPVYRIVYRDGERFYLDAVTGELAFAVDAARERYRWLFEALHRGDFARVVRMRPVWDLLMLPLLLGASCGAVTGTWLGLRRLLGGPRRAVPGGRGAVRGRPPAIR